MMKRWLGAAVLSIGCLVSTPAAAQSADPVAVPALGLGIWMTLSSTNLTTYGLSTYGIVALVRDLSKPKQARALNYYLNNNRHRVMQDVAVGGGARAEDLARAFGVPEEAEPAFGRALRSKRVELLEVLAQEELDMNATMTFAHIILLEMSSDPELAEYSQGS